MVCSIYKSQCFIDSFAFVFYVWKIREGLSMQNEPDNSYRPEFAIAYAATAFSGALVGFVIRLFVGWAL